MASGGNKKAVFQLDLDASDLTKSAADAAQSLKDLQRTIDSDVKAVAQMQKALRNLKLGGLESTQQFEDLKAAIDTQKASIGEAQAKYIAMGGSFTSVGRSSNGLIERLKQLEAANNQMRTPGALGETAQQMSGLTDRARAVPPVIEDMTAHLVDLNKPLEDLAGELPLVGRFLNSTTGAVLAMTAAMGALTVVTISAIKSLVSYGLAQADARRSELLRLEGMTKIINLYGIAAGKATDLQKAIDNVSDTTPLPRDKVAGLADELYNAGLRGANLEQALEGASIKLATQGETQAAWFKSWAKMMAYTGGDVKKLTDSVKRHLGGIATQQMLSLTTQTQKLHESLSKLFTGVDAQPLLRGIKIIYDMFSQSNASGRALKQLIDVMFTGIGKVVEKIAPVVEHFFIGAILMVQDLTIVALHAALALKSLLAADDTKFDLTVAAVWAGRAAILALGTAFVATGVVIVGAIVFAAPFIWMMVTAMGALAVAAVVLAAPFLLGALAIGAVIAAGYELWQLGKEFADTDLGELIMQGLVDGLKSGAKAVLGFISELGANMIAGFKIVLGIASPSKVFAALGETLPQGLTVGINAGAQSANDAIENMVEAPQSGGGGGGMDGGSNAGASQTGITIGSIVVNLSGAQSTEAQSVGQQIGQAVRTELMSVLTDLAMQRGAGV